MPSTHSSRYLQGHHQVYTTQDYEDSTSAAPPQSNGGGGGKQSKQEIHRRSARLRNTKYKSAPAAEKKVSTKGKGRRHIFKLKNPIKAPESVSTIITAESIFYKGVYYQIGDVVSFDPASYIIGPEEDLPRKMEYLEFVCHAPSEYFKKQLPVVCSFKAILGKN
ncbi:GATA zinc finger domain-containing protein 1 [Manis javanica]|nr:GATA zinc finger domain-containing protein 1 [Manis javanica]